jgi:hypothetical protein
MSAPQAPELPHPTNFHELALGRSGWMFGRILTVLVIIPAVVYGAYTACASGRMFEFFSMLGEFTIAFVIYYEIEANRAAHFLSEVQGEFYDKRRVLYEAFVGQDLPPGTSLKERVEAFGKKLSADVCLRSVCEKQWLTVDRLCHMLHWSLFHSSLVEKWFPHVLVMLWVMTNRYRHERESKRPFEIDYGRQAVKASLLVLKRRGKGEMTDLTIYGTNKKEVIIPANVLDQMLGDLDAPFK